VIEGYGLSESTCRSTFNPPDQRRRPGSCGMPIGNEMKSLTTMITMCPTVARRIVLRGENILKGYYKNPAATEVHFATAGFHRDIGLPGRGRLYYIVDARRHDHSRGEYLPA